MTTLLFASIIATTSLQAPLIDHGAIAPAADGGSLDGQSDPDPAAQDGPKELRRQVREQRDRLNRLTSETELGLELREIEMRIAALKLKTGEQKIKQNDLESRLDTVETEACCNEAGVGIGVGVDAKGKALFALEGHWRYLYGYYYAKHGFGIGLNFSWNFWRLKVRYLRLGVHIYGGDPMSSPYLRRTWDIALGSGFDFVIWRGLALNCAVAWYLPNPVAAIDLATNGIIQAAKESGYESYESLDPAKNVGDLYLDAFKKPWFFIGARWLF